MGVSTAPPAAATAAGTRSSQVDRLLCAFAWLSPSFARYVYSTLLRPGLGAVAPTHGLDVVALGRNTMAARRHRRLVILLALLDVVLVVAGVALLVGLGASPLWSLIVLVAGVLAYFLLIGGHVYAIRTRASRLVYGPAEPGDVVPRLRGSLEYTLETYANRNVVVFGAGIPFVGAGQVLTRWNVQVDTTKAAKDDQGRPRPVRPVSAEELQKSLSVAVRKTGIEGLRVNNRLFVDDRG